MTRDTPAPVRIVVRLVASSALMLLLELALIRWLGANVVHLSYFSNFVLLGSFLGVGLGFLVSRRDRSIVPVAMPLLALLVTAVLVFPVTIQRQGSDVIYFTAMRVAGPPAWLALPVVFLLVAVVMAGPAEMVGRCFGGLPPLTAYRYDLIGSLLGIGAFTLMSFLRAPSVVWGLVVSLVFLALAPGLRLRVVHAASGVVVVGMLLTETLTAGVSWSPYYKVATHHSGAGPGALSIWVNGVPHQTMAKAAWRLVNAPEQYDTPYVRLPEKRLRDVLVVGAGSGSDVAIALSTGAAHVDAVEIDPRILELGRQRNPDHAYQDPRVTTHVTDGRAFLENTRRRYDLILFALPDSLALVNGASQIRLESFLFTRQALESVRAHLRPDGGFAMYNFYREDWLIDRLAGTAATVFGHAPCVDSFTSHQAVVSVALHQSYQSCGSSYRPRGAVVAPATDDSPFLYFKGGMVPWLYVWTLLGVIAVSLVSVRAVGGPFRQMRPYADLFFMGAAFLLLETKNVASFALMFGTTWFVNALVFTGVLLIVLAAVETTRRFRTPPLPVVFGGIAVALGLARLIGPDTLLALSFWPRLVAAVVLGFAPVYLANVAFAKRFGATSDSQSAFGVNLLGSIVGGCLEYAALLTGYDNLLAVAGLLYLAAFVLTPTAQARPWSSSSRTMSSSPR